MYLPHISSIMTCRHLTSCITGFVTDPCRSVTHFQITLGIHKVVDLSNELKRVHRDRL